MSRFTPTRWNQILAWTGASLAWGTAFVAAKVEPVRTQETDSKPMTEVTTADAAAIPQAPASGLSIIRYQPTAAPAAEVQRVYVSVATPANTQSTASQPSATTKSNSAQPPPPPPAVAPPPDPPSSGS